MSAHFHSYLCGREATEWLINMKSIVFEAIKLFGFFLPAAVIFSGAAIKNIILVFSLFLILSILLAVCSPKSKETPFRKYLPVDLCLAIMGVMEFYHRWQHSSKVQLLASAVHLPKNVFLGGVAIVFGTLAVWSIEVLLTRIETLLHTYSPKLSLIKGWKMPVAKSVFHITILSILEILQFSYSTTGDLFHIFPTKVFFFFVNLCVVFCINIFLFVFLRRKTALVWFCAFFTIWSIANYYTLLYHGSPLFLSELRSLATAMTVVSNYDFSITREVLTTFGFFILELWVIPAPDRIPLSKCKTSLFVLTNIAAAFVALFLPHEMNTGNPSANIQQYGFSRA